MSAPHGGSPEFHPPPLAPGSKAPRNPRPHEVKVAVYLWIASFVVSTIGSVVSFSSTKQRLADDLHKQWANEPDLASVNVDAIIVAALVIATLLGLAIRVFLLVMFAFGRRWARTILAALGVVSVVGAVIGIRSASAAEAALTVVDALLIAGAIVYMFSAGAKEFFAPRPRQ